MQAGVGERALLAGGFLLQVRGTEVCERIVAAVVIELVAANECAERKHGRGIDQARPSGRDVVGANLGALIGGPDGSTVGTQAAICDDHAKPWRGKLPVERIGRLEPGTRV